MYLVCTSSLLSVGRFCYRNSSRTDRPELLQSDMELASGSYTVLVHIVKYCSMLCGLVSFVLSENEDCTRNFIHCICLPLSMQRAPCGDRFRHDCEVVNTHIYSYILLPLRLSSTSLSSLSLSLSPALSSPHLRLRRLYTDYCAPRRSHGTR